MTVLRGEVTTGVGDLAKRMRLHAEHYEAATGMRLYAGSLNLRLPDPWPLPNNTILLPAERVGRLVHLVPCSVSTRSCFVFRTDNAEHAGPDEQRAVEILAGVKLRDEFNLIDGDEVEIVVDDEMVGFQRRTYLPGRKLPHRSRVDGRSGHPPGGGREMAPARSQSPALRSGRRHVTRGLGNGRLEPPPLFRTDRPDAVPVRQRRDHGVNAWCGHRAVDAEWVMAVVRLGGSLRVG